MNEVMTEQQFWELVAASRKGWNPEDVEASRKYQTARLKRLLKPLSDDNLLAFERHFRRLHEAAYHWDLWAAASIYQGGCSDDGFHYFRNWLISMGREVYEAALQNPDTLAEVFPDSDDPDVEDQDFVYVCGEVYEARRKRYWSEEELFPSTTMPSDAELSPALKHPLSPEPKGKPYPEDPDANEAEFARRMPRLYAKFSGSED